MVTLYMEIKQFTMLKGNCWPTLTDQMSNGKLDQQ